MNNIRIAEIVKLEFVGELGRIRVQFKDPTSLNIEEGVLIYVTGDNACPAVGDQCMVFQIGCEYGMNYVMPYDIDNAPKILEGEKIIYGATGNKVYLKQSGNIEITTPEADFSADINLGGVLKVNNLKVVGNRGALVLPPVGGDIIDVEARVAINNLITRLQTHGLIA